MTGWWPDSADELVAEQERLARLRPPPWVQPAGELVAGGCFVAFHAGEAGPGRAGDRAFVGAVVLAGLRLAAEVVVPGVAGAPYQPGLLALREGPMLAGAFEALEGLARPVDVLLVDATGRDHPRHAGLALHLGAVLDVPTVGVTHRPLRAVGAEPGTRRGDWSSLELDGEEVARWVRTRTGVRPVVAHAAWRTDAAVAADVTLATTWRARTPEPLRHARRVARSRRSHAGAEIRPLGDGS